jgi:hypothetical protein
MKILLIGVVCFAAGWLAIEAGIIPPELARAAGFALAIPVGGMLSSWVCSKVGGCQAFALVLFIFAALIALPVLFGWMTWADWADSLEALVEWMGRVTG